MTLAQLPTLGSVPASLVAAIRRQDDAGAIARLAGDLRLYQERRDQIRTFTDNVPALAEDRESIGLCQSAIQACDANATLDEVRVRVGGLRHGHAQLREAHAAVLAALPALVPFGGPSGDGPQVVRMLIELADCVRQGQAFLDARNDRTTARSMQDRYAALAHAADSLRGEREKLDQEFSSWRGLAADDLRDLAILVRTTGWWGRAFGAPFKRAKAQYLRLTTGRAAPPAVMADAFERLALFREKWERWPATPDVRELAGAHHRGMETDFQALAACSAWSEKCRSKMGPLSDGEFMAIDWLMGAPSAELLALATKLSETRCLELRKWLDRASSVSLHSWLQSATADLDRVDDGLKRLQRAGVRGSCRLGELTSLGTAIADLIGAEEGLDQNRAAHDIARQLWRGTDTSVEVLERALEIRQTLESAGLSREMSDAVYADVATRLDACRLTGAAVQGALADEWHARSMAAAAGANAELVWADSASLSQARQMLRAAVRTQEHLPAWVAFRSAWMAAVQSPGPRDFLHGLDWSQIAPDHLADAYELATYRNLCSIAQRTFPALNRAEWSGVNLLGAMTRYAELDRTQVERRRLNLRTRLATSDVPTGVSARNRSSDLALIQYEAHKKRSHAPIRTLMKNAGKAVAKIKPCVMMSPLSVAQFLEPGAVSFDILVVDEASQMRPEDALGAFLRARQVVVVGDNQQLPPTSFFASAEPDEAAANEENQADDANVESILDLMLAGQARTSDLRWHYRSRHESLIAFSNQQFYDDRLNVFPSPVRDRTERGVSSRFVKGIYGGSVNRPEAEDVVEAVVKFMREKPQQSLGVVAMNEKQAELIRSLLDEKLRLADPGYLERWKDTLEPFFAKNLENVQGDERDVIFVSLTYGPNEAGRVFQRFGPINGAFGHRRLNVLLTRAKYQLVLFTSMRAANITLETGSGRGVRVLHDYLEFAEGTGDGPAVERGAMKEGRSQSYDCLASRLGDQGLALTHGVGWQGIQLPLAVKRPSALNNFACGVECDVAVDGGDLREHLRFRPELLGSLGWKTIRAWTSDWLRDPLGARADFHRGVEKAVGAKLPLPVSAKVMETHAPLAPVASAAEASPSATTAPKVPARVVGHGQAGPWAERLRRVPQFAESVRHPKWDQLVVPLVELLDKSGGTAAVAAVAESLRFGKFRIQGVIAEVQEQLNIEQHEVLRFDRPGGQVRLDLELLRQLSHPDLALVGQA
jgi:hypothetical protein